MANEVEASELAVAKEDLTNEDKLNGGSLSAEGVSVGDVAEGNTETAKEVKLEFKAKTEIMSEENQKPDLELMETKEIVTEKVTELEEPLELTEGNNEVVEKSDSEVVKESVLETKIDCVSGSVATGEQKLTNELKAEAEPVSSDEPLLTGEPKSAGELTAEAEPVQNEVATGEGKSADEPVAEPESVPCDKPAETGEKKIADEPVVEPELVPSDKPAETDEEKPAAEPIVEALPIPSGKPVVTEDPKSAGELTAEAEPVPRDKQVATDVEKPADKPILNDEPSLTGEPKSIDELTTEAEPVPSDKQVATDEEKPAAEPIPNDEPSLTGEPKSAGELTAEAEPVPRDKQVATDVEKPADKPILNDEPLLTGEPKSIDELTTEAEPVPSDEPKPEDKQPSSDEPKLDKEPSTSFELKAGDEVSEPEPVPSDEPEVDDEPSHGLEPKLGDQETPCSEQVDEAEVVDDELSPGLEPEAGDEQIPGPEAEAEADSEDEEKEVVQDEENNEEKVEKPLDDDQDRRNPQYIPKGGAFYEHDNRTSLEDVENKDPQDNEKKKKSWKESKDSEEWLHDCYNESEQLPKSTAEIIETYGYDIRRDDAPPRARRRRKYGRGPDKYERSWEDEQAYQIKQSNIGRRGQKKKLFGKDEFPPLPNQKFESSVSKPVHKSSIRKKEEVGPKSVNVKLNGNEKPPTTSQVGRPSHSGNHNNLHNFNSNRKSYSTPNKKINDSDIKPFRNDDNKWKMPFKHGRQDDFPKPIKMQTVRHTEPPFKRSMEVNKNSTKEPHISHITDGINQMTFVNQKQADMRDVRLKANGPEESKISEPEVDNPANRQNPKRYSKIRKGFTGLFPPEEVPELDQSELHKLQQEQQKSQHLNMTQPLNMQNVMKRYAGTYGNLSNCVSDFVPGSSSYLQARPIISAIPQQALSPQGIHQQALSPQGIPQQALSPQVPGLPTIELQQNPLAQPNFIPQPMYVDAHFTSDVMGPFSGYSPYSGSQTGDVYQPPRGITYYNTESQTTGQKRPPPRRQNAAIPIVPPPE